MKLSSGLFRWDLARDSGVPVGIGTDGAASNNNLDYIEEMRTAVLLARGVSGKPDVLSPWMFSRLLLLYRLGGLDWN